jgi:threonine synthase
VNRPGLKKLRDAARAYSVSLATSGGFKDPKEVAKQLEQHKLSAAAILELCTVAQGAK